MVRIRKQCLRLSKFNDPACIHHGNPVADMPDYAQIMRDKDIGQPQILLQVCQQIDHLCLDSLRIAQPRFESSST